ncbi:hypothetical protein Lal_00000786 [Lupinus albus]|nr:hypothetical protein Lal_00000786 [Lupinus albus]
MASRPIIPIQQQARGEGVVGGGKHQKNGVVDEKNRKALGDIGNIDLVKGVKIKLIRPITRYPSFSLYFSFVSHLLYDVFMILVGFFVHNYLSMFAAENNKVNTQYNSLIHLFDIPNVDGPKPYVVDGVDAKRVTPKPVEKKVIAKPKPNEVIEINSVKQAQKINM